MQFTLSEIVTLLGVVLSVGYNYRVLHEMRENNLKRDDKVDEIDHRLDTVEVNVAGIEARKQDHERRLSSLEAFNLRGLK